MKRCYGSFVFIALMLFGASNECHAATTYIKPDGTGDQPTIQAGVSVSAPGDSLLLAAGTFVGAGNKEVLIAYPGLVVTSESGAELTIIDCEGSGRGFIYLLAASAVLRGITIRNGNPDPDGSGGAVFYLQSSPSFVDCVFESNTGFGAAGGSGGGAVFCGVGSPTFQNCSFIDNKNVSTNGTGGAISLSECVHAQILGCSFEDNITSFSQFSAGGAVFDWFSSRITISGCEFRRNGSTVGGAVDLSVDYDQVEISASIFEDNFAQSGAGLSGANNLTVTDCQFLRNTAEAGGAVNYSIDPVAFERCLFQDNEATTWGGAVASFIASGQFTECIFSGNSSPQGGAMLISGHSTVVQNCTFHANSSQQGSVFGTREGGTASVSNSILAFNAGEVVSCSENSGATLACSDVYGTVGGDYVGCIASQGGINANFSADPLFCGKDENDFTIQSNSPCAPPGVTNCGLVGALPVGCGPTSVAPASWGQIKGRYR